MKIYSILCSKFKLRSLVVLISAVFFLTMRHNDLLAITSLILALALFITDNFIISKILGGGST